MVLHAYSPPVHRGLSRSEVFEMVMSRCSDLLCAIATPLRELCGFEDQQHLVEGRCVSSGIDRRSQLNRTCGNNRRLPGTSSEVAMPDKERPHIGNVRELVRCDLQFLLYYVL